MAYTELQQLVIQSIVRFGLESTLEAIATYCQDAVDNDVRHGNDTKMGQIIRSEHSTAAAGLSSLVEQIRVINER